MTQKKNRFKKLICLLIMFGLVVPSAAFAWEGDSGYEGGISSGVFPTTDTKITKRTFGYQEVCFVTGEPIVFKGATASTGLTLSKTQKQGSITSTYTYTLVNNDRKATLTRKVVLVTKLTKKDNGQTIEETLISGTPTEVIKIGANTYVMKAYNFSRSNILDSKPAINYYSGNLSGAKTYTMASGTGTAAVTATVTVEFTGDYYGYDQYWGTAEVESLDYVIKSEQKKSSTTEKWGGTAHVNLSLTTAKKMRYVENQPGLISFLGGYVQSQNNTGILQYTSSLPEFDSAGNATDTMLTAGDSLLLETSPVQTRLTVPVLGHIRGHWAEGDVKTLYSLEVFKDNATQFEPEQYMTRAEFAGAIINAAREVPVDPTLGTTTTTASRTTTSQNQKTAVSPFSDVAPDSSYFNGINSAFKRGIMTGRDIDAFAPDDNLTMAEALAVFIRALGLKDLAPGPAAVTTFRDNDEIPAFARNAAYVAEKIGLVQGDDKGYLYPNSILTKARAAALMNRLINYMREDIMKDYKERIVNY